jgi:hypothetical protein
LTHLPLKQGVGQQGQHVDKEHGGDALVLVEIERRDRQIIFADVEAFSSR